jgi:hypothetical protein
MASLKLTVATVAGKPPLHISIPSGNIVALGPAAGGGTVVRISTREITVTESVDRVLELWLGPNNGADE